MTDTLMTHVDDDEDLYPLSQPDRIGVLSSTKPVIELGEHVWINKDQIELLSDLWIQDAMGASEVSDLQADVWDRRYHFHDGSERTVNWILVLDALNFCFWAEKDQQSDRQEKPGRWTIDYQGETLNGYWAEAAALKRAVEEDMPLWDAQFLSTISAETVAQIFRGSPSAPPIPLFERRVEHMREVGRVLLERYDGQFARAIEQVQGSAVELVLLLVRDFPSFRDVAQYRNYAVRFFKRAQICVADLYTAFRGKHWGTFPDVAQLSAFADYKLPQVLRHAHILEYEPALAALVNSEQLLAASCEEEIEIRAATVWACELLRQSMAARGHLITAQEIDQRLWFMGQHSTEMLPYHRTRTVNY